MIWTIIFGSEPASEIGTPTSAIADVVRTLKTQATDTATLLYRDADLRKAAPWPHGTRVRIFRDGTCWFAGKVDLAPRSAQGSNPALSLELVNAWAELDRIVYQRAVAFVDYASAASGSDLLASYPTVSLATSAVLLNTDESGSKIDTAATIRLALNYALETASIHLQIGTIEPGVQVPREELRDIALTEMIRASLRWTPDLTTWWDYSVDPPRFSVTKRRSKTALDLDTQTTLFGSISLKPRPDLVLSGVTLNYLQIHDRPSFQFKTLLKDFAGVHSGLQIHRTIELYGSRWTTTTDSTGATFPFRLNPAEDPPIGVAARVLDSLNDLHFEGSVEIIAQDCPAGNLLGMKLNIAHHTPESAAMNADIRGQTDTLSTGTTTLEIGPPPQLGAADFVELLRAGRPVEALNVSQQTSSPYAPQPTPPPTPAATPNVPQGASFAPDSPDVILKWQKYTTNNGATGQGTGGPFYQYGIVRIHWRNAPQDATDTTAEWVAHAGTISSTNTVVRIRNVKVGYAALEDIGQFNGTSNIGRPLPPPPLADQDARSPDTAP